MLRDWVPLFLFLHVMGAIVAFGPTFAFPIIGAQSAKQPQHAHFGALISELIEKRIVIPLAIVQGVTGVLLILAAGFDWLNTRWLLVGILLYAIALAFAILVQAPAAARMVELTEMPAGGPPPGAGGPPPGAGGPPPGAGGPPPELLATAKKLQRGGMVLSVLIVLIVILMVTKPF
jgi:uncharacterized membrane protein